MILRAESSEWMGGRETTAGVVEFPRPELRLAREILSFLPDDVEVSEHDAGNEIWYSLRSNSPRVRLRRVIMKVASLTRLGTETHRDVKIGYLRRELARALPSRQSWSYPR